MTTTTTSIVYSSTARQPSGTIGPVPCAAPSTRSADSLGGRHRRQGERLQLERGYANPITLIKKKVRQNGVLASWVWRRDWSLDKAKAEYLAYNLKTRGINIVLGGVALQLMNWLPAKVLIVTVGTLAGTANLVSEYIKHRIGTHGVSVTIGVRRHVWVLFTPSLNAVKLRAESAQRDPHGAAAGAAAAAPAPCGPRGGQPCACAAPA